MKRVKKYNSIMKYVDISRNPGMPLSAHLLVLFFAVVLASTVLTTLFGISTIWIYPVLMALLAVAAVLPEFWRTPKDRFELYLFLFCSYGMASALWSGKPMASFAHAAAIWALWRFIEVTYPKDHDHIAKVWQYLSIVVFCYVLVIAGLILSRPYYYLTLSGYHWLYGFGSPNYIAAVLLCCLLITAMAFMIKNDSIRMNFILAVSFFVSIMLLLLANSRSVLASVVMITAILACYHFNGLWYVKRYPYKTLLIASFVLICLVMVLLLTPLKHLLLRDYWIFYSDGRPFAWSFALTRLFDKPYWYLGLGMGQQAQITKLFFNEGRLSADNVYIDIMLNLGIIGLTLFLMMVYQLMKTSLWFNRCYEGYLSVLTASSVFVLLLWHGMLESLLLQQLSGMLFMLFLLNVHARRLTNENAQASELGKDY